MSLTPGSRVGSYEIVSAIGEGGMGEVYRGRDTKLQRDVAIKVLPDLFAADPDRLARFQREAQILASLNHPNIAHVYGVEDRALIYVQAFPVASGKWQISQNGGAQARWSADGKRLYYMALDGRLHVVDVRVNPDGGIDVVADTPLFTPRTAGGPVPGSDKQTYAVAKDGRLLIIVRPEGDQPSPLSVILNWTMSR